MKRIKRWSRLDNAAKIFPVTSLGSDTKVFRFVCELYEDIQPEPLQAALESTVAQFPFYCSVLKKGLFWYYLESSPKKPVISEENLPLCAALYNGDVKTLLFRVSYRKNRINLEIYHALTDGTGALYFLRTLVLEYINIVHAEELGGEYLSIDYDASSTQKQDDSFSRYFGGTLHVPREKLPAAHHVCGERLAGDRVGLIEGRLSASELHKLSKARGVTLTVYVAALIIQAVFQNMTVHERRRPVVLSVPVNLRNYFPSVSARNFFGVVRVGCRAAERPLTFDEILKNTAESFKEQLTEERLAARVNMMAAIERSIPARITPLMLKNPVMLAAYLNSRRRETGAFSNLGRIGLPERAHKYVRLFDVFSSTDRLQCCMCSYLDELMISFTTPFSNTDVQCAFFRELASLGLSVEITSGNFLQQE